MNYIPELVFTRFLVELDLYCNHLSYVLKELDVLNKRIEKEFDQIEGNYDYETGDEGVIWGQATENVLGTNTFFIPDYQKIGAIAGYCIIIFHFLERFLEEIAYLKEHIGVQSFDQFMKTYPQFRGTTHYRKVVELKRLANYCKHGRGMSENKLRKMRPDYFDTLVFRTSDVLLKPLSGYDIKIVERDFREYIHNIKLFTEDIKKQFS